MIDDDDYRSIIEKYPEMILISQNPATWHGFLKVPSNSGQNIRIRLKLIIRNYPSLHNVEIKFGKEIAFIHDRKFSKKLRDLTHNTTKVSTFLRQLQSLIRNFINDSHIIESNGYKPVDNDRVKILNELKDILEIPSEVQILSNNSLSIIKLSYNNMAVQLKRTNHGKWTVIYTDLPEIPNLGPFENNISTLMIARNKLKLQVEMLEKSWSNLKQIDENCWVLDPLNPKPCHLYRRIYLTPSLSMIIKINVSNATALPEIKFMGSDVEIESKKELVSMNLDNWNPECNIIDNLTMLLNIDSFPKKQVNKESQNSRAVVADEECCICFSLELDNETLPDKICSNKKCRKHFHTSCLLQWLQTIAGNHIVFDYIHDSCPNCQEDISCCIK
ncbi:E3 ubiquitin-protein ligase Fancl [Xylocopa sonorina]|uniref:E3 ubiquitin-protein ligase Fancl n=1 Tax=Xylocopa sonorina TaxID=1818115 RepID=UPI00403AB892